MKLFSKSLTATDCLKRLSIPKRVLTCLPEYHGGHAVELQVRYETKEWPIVCTIRKKGYKKPVLSKGWRKFVLESRLNVDDELTFHREEDDESGSLFYRVEVKRAAATTRQSRALSRLPSALDPAGLDESQEITGARSCNTYETSAAGITSSSSPPYKVGFPKDEVASNSTVNTNNNLFREPSVDTKDAGDFNVNEEKSKAQYAKEQRRELKRFGAIIGGSGALVVDSSDTIDREAYHNSVKQLCLSDDAEDRASLIRREEVKQETAVHDNFSLGLTMGGAVVHVHDKATSCTEFDHKTEQGLGFECLDMMMLCQSTRERSDVNLDLTLKPPILS